MQEKRGPPQSGGSGSGFFPPCCGDQASWQCSARPASEAPHRGGALQNKTDCIGGAEVPPRTEAKKRKSPLYAPFFVSTLLLLYGKLALPVCSNPTSRLAVWLQCITVWCCAVCFPET